jgi:hypothetical protein
MHGVYDATGEKQKIRIVRLGEPLQTSTDSQAVLDLTLDAQVEAKLRQDPSWAKLQDVDALINKGEAELEESNALLNAEVRRNGGPEPDPRSKELRAAKVRTPHQINLEKRVKDLRIELSAHKQTRFNIEMSLERLRFELQRTILNEANIVAATLSGTRPFLSTRDLS